MVRIEASYQGELRCAAVHGPSGQTVRTDAPVDNQGRGEFFAPTDLVATALGTCIMTIMGIYAERTGLSLQGLSVRVEKEMATEPPRRIARLALDFHMPAGLSERDRTALAACVERCPVRLSLHPDIRVPVTFHYPD